MELTNDTLLVVLNESGEVESRCSWLEFLSDNAEWIDRGEVGRDLDEKGTHTGGGGAQPVWTLTFEGCNGFVYPRGLRISGLPCQSSGKFFEEGWMWCGVHAPSKVKARSEKRRRNQDLNDRVKSEKAYERRLARAQEAVEIILSNAETLPSDDIAKMMVAQGYF